MTVSAIGAGRLHCPGAARLSDASTVEQVHAKANCLVVGKVGKENLRIANARDVDLQRGEAEDPRKESLSMSTACRRESCTFALVAVQHARVDPKITHPIEPVGESAPQQVAIGHQHHKTNEADHKAHWDSGDTNLPRRPTSGHQRDEEDSGDERKGRRDRGQWVQLLRARRGDDFTFVGAPLITPQLAVRRGSPVDRAVPQRLPGRDPECTRPMWRLPYATAALLSRRLGRSAPPPDQQVASGRTAR